MKIGTMLSYEQKSELCRRAMRLMTASNLLLPIVAGSDVLILVLLVCL